MPSADILVVSGAAKQTDLLLYSSIFSPTRTHDTAGSRYVPAPQRVRAASRHRIRISCLLGPADVRDRQTVRLPVSLSVTPTVRSASSAGLVMRTAVLNPRHEADDDLSLLLLLNGDH